MFKLTNDINVICKQTIRDVPINKRCEVALKKQLLQKKVIASRTSSKPLPGFDKLVFTTRYNTPLNSQIYCDAIKSIVAEINLTRDDLEQFEPLSGHCFRHTFATRCFESSIQPKTVQKYLGHATLQMTMDLYTHVLENHLTDEMEKLETRLEEIELTSDDLTVKSFQSEHPIPQTINDNYSSLQKIALIS